jgi:hypothetical protein
MNDAVKSGAPPSPAAPWPVRLITLFVFLLLTLLVSGWLVLIATLPDIDPEKGMSCVKAHNEFDRVRHNVLCHYLVRRFPEYLPAYSKDKTIAPLRAPGQLIGIITVDILSVKFLFLLALTSALLCRKVILYVIVSAVLVFHGISNLSLSFTVVGALACAVMLSKPSRDYLAAASEEST